MSNVDGKCDCAAFGPDECVCGAWDDAQRTTEQIRRAVDAACTCGGAGPGEGCPACNVWHILYPANASVRGGAEAPYPARSVGGFDPCCGQPPKVTEWRPGCYGAQCMKCGGIVGDERQLDRTELMAEWNRVMRKRTANNRITEK